MFKEVYKVDKWQGIKTNHHKKYFVFDGLGIVYFENLQSARSYITIKSRKAENLYKYAKTLYCEFTNIYMSKLIGFRIKEDISLSVKNVLTDCLESFQYMTRKIHTQYMLSKLKQLYINFERLAVLLTADLLTKRLRTDIDVFFSDKNYPSYNTAINALANNNHIKKAI